jgi:FkbM family methyltransferase
MGEERTSIPLPNGSIMDPLKHTIINGISCWYRPGSVECGSDLDAFNEVLGKEVYGAVSSCRPEPGETWLDLGANVGAFALYCTSKGATAVCYEPDDECYRVLLKNTPRSLCVHAAVSVSSAARLDFYSREPKNPDNHWRGTVTPNDSLEPEKYGLKGLVNNIHAKHLIGKFYHGVKMDIEGSEGPILDNWFLPQCNKLILEYHTCRDSSVTNLSFRLNMIKERFKHVLYPPAYDEVIAQGVTTYRPEFDQLIFAWDPK